MFRSRCAHGLAAVLCLAQPGCSLLYPFDEFHFDGDAASDLGPTDDDAASAPDSDTDADVDATAVPDSASPTDAVVVDVPPPFDAAACTPTQLTVNGPSVCPILGCPIDRCATPNLHDVAGNNRHDLWAVGQYAAIYHFDGTTWTLQHLGARTDSLNAIVAYPHGQWAVGDHGLILGHLDVGNWAVVTPALTGENLRDVTGAPTPTGGPAAFGVWAVGNHGVILNTVDVALSSWRTVTSPTNDDLVSVSAADGFGLAAAVGGTFFRKTASTAWSQLPSAGVPRGLHTSSVSVYGANAAWISADEGLYHLTGATIAQIPNGVTSRHLLSVWGDANTAIALLLGDRQSLVYRDFTLGLMDTDVSDLEALGMSLDGAALLGVGANGGYYFFHGGP